MPPTGISNDEAIILPSVMQVDLLAGTAARKAILEHLELCPFKILQIEQRVRLLENKFSLLIGYMIGTGIIGGTIGAWIVQAAIK